MSTYNFIVDGNPGFHQNKKISGIGETEEQALRHALISNSIGFWAEGAGWEGRVGTIHNIKEYTRSANHRQYLVQLSPAKFPNAIIETIVAVVEENKPGPEKQFPYRLELRYDDTTKQALAQVTERTGEDTSTIIRRLIREAA